MGFNPAQKRGAEGTDLGGEFVGPKSIAHFLMKLLQTPKGGKAEDRPDMRRGVGRFVTAGGSVASLRLPPRSVRADDRVVDTRDARRLGRVASVDKAAGTMTVHWDDGSPAERRPIETVHDPIHDPRRSFDAAPVDHPPKLDAAVGGPRRQDTPSGRMHDLVASGAVAGEDRRRALDVARSGALSADQARASMRTTSATPHPPRQTYTAELRAGVVPAHMEPSESPAAAKVARAKAPAKPAPAKATLSAADREKRTKAMARQYASGASIDDIAAEHGVSSSTVHTSLTNSGVQLRPRGGSTRAPEKADVAPPARVAANPKRRQLLQRIADEPGSLPTDLRTSPELAELEREGHIRRTYPRASPSASTNQSIGGAHFALTPSGRRELRDLNTHANSAALYAVVDRHDPFSPASAAARVPAKKAAAKVASAKATHKPTVGDTAIWVPHGEAPVHGTVVQDGRRTFVEWPHSNGGSPRRELLSEVKKDAQVRFEPGSPSTSPAATKVAKAAPAKPVAKAPKLNVPKANAIQLVMQRQEMSSYGGDFRPADRTAVDQLIQDGLLVRDGDRLSATDAGRQALDAFSGSRFEPEPVAEEIVKMNSADAIVARLQDVKATPDLRRLATSVSLQLPGGLSGDALRRYIAENIVRDRNRWSLQ